MTASSPQGQGFKSPQGHGFSYRRGRDSGRRSGPCSPGAQQLNPATQNPLQEVAPAGGFKCLGMPAGRLQAVPQKVMSGNLSLASSSDLPRPSSCQ